MLEQLDERIEEAPLSLEQLLVGGHQVEPRGSVHFGKRDLASGAPRPFHGDGVADRRGHVEVAFDSPRGDDFAAALADVAERTGRRTWGRAAELFGELSERDVEGFVVGAELALGDRPGTGVTPSPERSARVHEQHLGLTVASPVEQQAGASSGHGPKRTRVKLDGEPAGNLLAAVQQLLSGFATERDRAPAYLTALVEAARSEDGGAARSVMWRLRDRLARVVLTQREGRHAPDWVDPDAMAALIISAANGIVLPSALDPDGPTVEQMATQLALLFLTARTAP